MDPDRDGCGLLWCAPVAPWWEATCAAVTGIATEILLRHGFEPMISITLITERSAACVITIAYDRSIPGEDQKALGCYQELLRRLWSAGYYSYRLGIQSMQEMSGDNGFNRLLREYKTNSRSERYIITGSISAALVICVAFPVEGHL